MKELFREFEDVSPTVSCHLLRKTSFGIIYAFQFSFLTVLKKTKHRFVETMSSNTADALGLSRAILCNGKDMKSGFAFRYRETARIYMYVCMYYTYSTIWF